jgi:hypothetical protein
MDIDFKASTIVAEWLENKQAEKDGVSILPIGASRSAIAADVNGYGSYFADSLQRDVTIVEQNREGLYDMLPEGLFHVTPIRSAGLNEAEMMADVQLRRREEKDARRFFMPFESELNYMRVLLEWYENRLDKRSHYNDLSLVFGAEWKEIHLLDNDQRMVWMHLLPVIQHKRNDIDFLGAFLSVLFNLPVAVVRGAALSTKMPIAPGSQLQMGGGALGTDSVIGSSFEVAQDAITIHLGPAEGHKLVSFLPGNKHAMLMDTVLTYLVPIETAVDIQLVISKENRTGSLSAGSANTFLGYTVYL